MVTPPPPAAPQNEIEVVLANLTLYLSDVGIFVILVRPTMKERAEIFANSRGRRLFELPAPKMKGKAATIRTNADVGRLFEAYWERGIFETHIISMVSRFEVALQECMSLAIRRDIERLRIIADGKSGVPLELIISAPDREDVLDRYVAMRCETLMFGTPSAYLDKAVQVLRMSINDHLKASYIEIKASRDIIVHNQGTINRIYVEKAGVAARGKEGDRLAIDEEYFTSVIDTLKNLVDQIRSGSRDRTKKKE